MHVLFGQGGQFAGAKQLAPFQFPAIGRDVAAEVAEVGRSLQGQAAFRQDRAVAAVGLQVEVVPYSGIGVGDQYLAVAGCYQRHAEIPLAVKVLGVVGHVDADCPGRIKRPPADPVFPVIQALDVAAA